MRLLLILLIIGIIFSIFVDAKTKKRGKRKVKGKDKGAAKAGKKWQPAGSNQPCERDWDCPKGSGEICIWKKCIEQPSSNYHDEL
ncbi:unnamed protein product, partial [Mesorhabditis spiculigera]